MQLHLILLQLPAASRYTRPVVQEQARARRADAGAAQPDSPAEIVSTWRALAARHAAVVAALERELGERHGLGVTEFEVLERLAEDDEHKFRVQELAESVHLSQSALSRLITRLEKTGLVTRCVCEDDRRSVWTELTPLGAQRYAEARPTHRAILTELAAGGPQGECEQIAVSTE